MTSSRLSRALRCFRQSPDTLTGVVMTAASPSFAMGAFARLRGRRAPVTCDSPTILPPDVPIEEELVPDPKHFYPVNPGDLFHGRYETITKLGWGSCSTVWLA